MITKEKYGLNKHTARFDTERKCHDFLVQARWNGKPQCPACKNDIMNYRLTTRNIYKCSCCYKQFSVTQGTVFERSKIPLTMWFLAIYFFTINKRGISSCQLATLLEIQQRSAWFMLQRLRMALKEENDIILRGIVEADETFVGPNINRDTRLQKERREHYAKQEAIHGMTESKRRRRREKPGKVGRKKGSTKEVLEQKKLEMEMKGERIPYERCTIILGMVEQGGKIVMKSIGHNRMSINKDNIYPHLKNHISSKSIFITDQSNVYFDTKYLFSEHLIINHDKRVYAVDGVHINNIENSWKHLKKTIDGTYFHLSKQHFDKYLGEFTYRWNRRKESKVALFDSFIPLITGKKITYKELVSMNKKMAA